MKPTDGGGHIKYDTNFELLYNNYKASVSHVSWAAPLVGQFFDPYIF